MNVLAKTRIRGAIHERMQVAADRYLALSGIDAVGGEVDALAARWTEELLAAQPELPDIRQYDDPAIQKKISELNAALSAFLDELYGGVVGQIDTHLSQDALELAEGWVPNEHPRWPHGTPGVDSNGHPLGGEFLRIGDLLSKLKTTLTKREDVSFVASGARNIRDVTATPNPDGSRVDFHVDRGADGKPHVVTTAANVDTGVLVETLRRLDTGENLHQAAQPTSAARKAPGAPSPAEPSPTRAGGTQAPGAGGTIDEIAQHLQQAAQKAEPQVSSDLVELVGAAGGQMAGFGNRLKTLDSMKRKLDAKSREKGISPAQYAAKMADNLRYTAQLDQNHADGVQKMLDSLSARGYQFDPADVENNWANPIYHGINMNVRTPDGYVFELQFHTAESLRVKELNHKLYEQQRLVSTSPQEREQLNRMMNDNISNLQRPEGILTVGTLVKHGVEAQVAPEQQPNDLGLSPDGVKALNSLSPGNSSRQLIESGLYHVREERVGDRITLHIEAKGAPPGAKTYTKIIRDPETGQEFTSRTGPTTYDPAYMGEQRDTIDGKDYGTLLKPHEGVVGFIGDAVQKQDGMIYRGISSGEFDSIQQTGRVQSNGSYNLGEAQAPFTLFGEDPGTAGSYASSFAPPQFKPTWDKPAYVLVVHEPPGAVRNDPSIAPPGEVAIHGGVDASHVAEVWKGSVIASHPSKMDFVQQPDGSWQFGGSNTDTPMMRWERIANPFERLAARTGADALESQFPVGQLVTRQGADHQYEVVGYWRGYVTVRDVEKGTTVKVRPADLNKV